MSEDILILTKSSSSETTTFLPLLFLSTFLPGVLEKSAATPPIGPSTCWCNFLDDRDTLLTGERTPFTWYGSDSEPFS